MPSIKPKYWYLIFLIPCIALLTPPFFNFATPELAGVPFFYWYQFLWLIITAALTVGIYVLRRRGKGVV